LEPHPKSYKIEWIKGGEKKKKITHCCKVSFMLESKWIRFIMMR
jgi:hypothetical protein